MKKLITLSIAALLCFTVVEAQVSVGLKGGLTMSTMSFDIDTDESSVFAFGGHAAVFMRTNSGLFSFQPEVMWIQKGTRVNANSSAEYAQFTMNYIDVPLLLRATIGIKVVEIYFNLGPYAGYWLGGKEKYYFYDDSQGIWVTEKEDFDFDEDRFNRFDAGVVGGVGVKVLMLLFELRYGHGFIDVFDYEESNNTEANRYFNISLGIQL